MQQFSFQKDLSKTLLMYTVPAVQGFFRSISLSRGNNLQDTLRYIIKHIVNEIQLIRAHGLRLEPVSALFCYGKTECFSPS